MNEKRFLFSIFAEGSLLIFLGLTLLLLPKMTKLSFGIVLCVIFLIYGIFKIYNSIKTKNVLTHYWYNITLGVLLTVFSITMICSPMLIFPYGFIFIGIYLILESFSSYSFAMYSQSRFNMWWLNLCPSFWQFLFGLIIIFFITNIDFYIICLFVGFQFLINGSVLIKMYISNKYLPKYQ